MESAMEFEYWYLLAIPLFFGLGWFAARGDRRLATRAPEHLSGAYFKGLNYLLNEQSDKAIDAFIEVVRIEPEAIELHFALGSLFRRRGETERAIRVHENLVERGDLDAEQRAHALFELGQDFLKAGLIDRAEDAFNRLEGTAYAGAASRLRLEIAQRTHDWPRVIDLARDGPVDPAFDTRRIVAHAFCELAIESLKARRFDEARAHAHEAREAAAEHPRPAIVLGRIAFEQEAWGEAIRAWEPLAGRHPRYVALVARDWMEAGARDGGDRGLRAAIARMQRLEHAAESTDLVKAVAEAIARLDGKPAAAQWVRQILVTHPSLLGLQLLLDLSHQEPAGQTGSAAEMDEAALRTLVRRQAERMSRYVCSVCAFRAQHYYWQCPGCNRWDSYSPLRTEELESAQ